MDSKKAEEMIKTGKLLCDIDAALMIIPIFCEPIKNFLVRRQKNTRKNLYFIGSISSFLILNSGKDCKDWRSQFRSVAKE